MQITFKARNIITYQSFDKKKSLARRQNSECFHSSQYLKGVC